MNAELANVYALPLLDEAHCDELLAQTSAAWEEGRSTGEANLRSVRQQLLPVADDGTPLRQLHSVVKRLNDAHWKFEIAGFVDGDRPWVMRYDAERGDKFDWHIDLGPHQPTRKLSFSIQLTPETDYDGGDLEFLHLEFPRETLRKRGTIVVFPSFLAHRVTTTTRGSRTAIVGWIHGPSFR